MKSKRRSPYLVNGWDFDQLIGRVVQSPEMGAQDDALG